MPLRLRLALWYGALSAVMISLVAFLGYGAYVRGQYQTLDQVLLLSANHVEAGWRAAGRSYVLEADLSQLEVAFRLYSAEGAFKRSSREMPDLPEADPILVLQQPSKTALDQLTLLLPRFEPAVQIPEMTAFTTQYYRGQRWRVVVTQLERSSEVLGYLEAVTPLGHLDQASKRLGWLLLALEVLSVGGVFGLSLAVAQVALRPVNQLSQTAVEIAHSRDLSRRVIGGSSRDELGLLGNTFNEMLESLEQSAATQQRFVADASHELRAPLAAIQGNLELLHRYPLMSDSDREETILKAIRETSRLNRLVADLLTLARSDSGLPIRHIVVDLKAVVQDALGDAKHLLSGQYIEATNLEELRVSGDPDHLKQLVLILLDNAINYTPPGGRINIELLRQPNHALFRISDTGVGIPADALGKIFDRFFRADPSRSPHKGGTGLGLSIANWIVLRHSGQIRVESQVNQGTVMTVYLPFLSQVFQG